MKKVLLSLAVVAVLTVVSCKKAEPAVDAVATDSTAVEAVDSAAVEAVDSTAVDSAAAETPAAPAKAK